MKVIAIKDSSFVYNKEPNGLEVAPVNLVVKIKNK
jgi:hypothetical protein